MQRIVIVGTSGCGKSTLALQLEHLLGIPHYDLDDYYWLPNWQPNPASLKILLNKVLQENSWIISGNYSDFQSLLWEKADTIIWLDFSLTRCLYQGLKRSVKRMLFRQTCCNGNYETFKRTFLSSHSLLKWILTTYKRRRDCYHQLFQRPKTDKCYFRFKNLNELKNWLLKSFA